MVLKFNKGYFNLKHKGVKYNTDILETLVKLIRIVQRSASMLNMSKVLSYNFNK